MSFSSYIHPTKQKKVKVKSTQHSHNSHYLIVNLLPRLVFQLPLSKPMYRLHSVDTLLQGPPPKVSIDKIALL